MRGQIISRTAPGLPARFPYRLSSLTVTFRVSTPLERSNNRPIGPNPNPRRAMLRKGILVLSESSAAKKILTGTRLTRSMSQRFVPGETVDSVIDAARSANAEGLKVTANYLGEYVEDRPTAIAAADAYIELLSRIQDEGLDANVSLKFTQMGQGIDEGFLRENLGRVLEQAEKGKTFLRFDMESSDLTQRTLDAFEEIWSQGWQNTGVVLQAYLHRTTGDVERMIELGARVRLCKGAYDEPEKIAYKEMDRIRINLLELMQRLLTDGNYPAIASHDPMIIDATRAYAEQAGIPRERFEFQMLFGVRRDLQQELVEAGYNVRVYIPFGEMWYPYLMRRLAERPENLRFMAGGIIRDSPFRFLMPGGRKPASVD